MLKVKICGMRDASVMDAVNECLPDYIGFILSSGYSRSVDIEKARAISAAADERIERVGVFVNEDIEYVLRFADMLRLECIQLHGGEDEAYIAAIKKRCDAKIIKTVTYAALIEGRYPGNADILLLDATARRGFEGGKAEDIDLSSFKTPVYLAGGLTPENVGEYIERFSPAGVDTSSGVETDGRKDAAKIRKFIEEARRHG